METPVTPQPQEPEQPPAEVRAAAEPGPLTADEGMPPGRGSEIRAVLRDGKWFDVPVASWARMVQDLLAANDRLAAERDGLQRFADSHAPNVADQEAKRVALETEIARMGARIRDLKRDLEPYERLTEQSCPKGEHPVWLVDSENHHACPWCQIKALEAVKGELEDRLTARLAELAARPSRAAVLREAAGVAEDVASRLRHRNQIERGHGADSVWSELRRQADAAEGGAS